MKDYINTIVGGIVIANQVAIFRRLDQIMGKLEDFQGALSQVDAETTRIGEYIESVLVQLNRTDLTDAQEATVLASLQAAADRLKQVGVSVTQPVPTEELPPVEEPPAEEQPPTEG